MAVVVASDAETVDSSPAVEGLGCEDYAGSSFEGADSAGNELDSESYHCSAGWNGCSEDAAERSLEAGTEFAPAAVMEDGTPPAAETAWLDSAAENCLAAESDFDD